MYQETVIDSLSIFLILALVFGAITIMFEFGFRITQRLIDLRDSLENKQ